MFYYGLDFHDLAPDAILHISSFIIVCEAFLHVTPHFGLWLKTFNVKPKVVDGKQAECGGAIVSKLTNTPWPKAPSQKLPTYGSGSGFTSLNPAVPSGQLHLRSDLALQYSSHHGSIRGWTGDQLTKCGLYKAGSGVSLRRTPVSST